MGDFVVAKFGGTSVQDAQSMLKCAEIIAKDKQIKIVVVSATAQTTNHLENIAQVAQTGSWEEASELIEKMRERHLQIGEQLRAGTEVFNQVNSIIEEASDLAKGMSLLKECTKRTMDHLYSIGERLSSTLFQVAVEQNGQKVTLKDAREVINTNNNFGAAMPYPLEIRDLIANNWRQELDSEGIILTQGFIGSTPEGITTTLGREGSDYSATLIAEAIDANHIQIWKDVCGVATCDPRLIDGVRYIPELSYSAMGELSTLGAKVLHPYTLRPAMRKNIPVYMANTFEPQTTGTWIKEVSFHRPLVQAMAIRENQTLISFTSNQMVAANQFFAQVFNTLSKFRVPLDLVNTHENHMTFLMQPRTQLREEVKKELENWCDIHEEDNLALVSLVGHGMDAKKGFMTRLFAFLDNYSIRQLNFGTGKHGLSLLVKQNKARTLLGLLHRFFVEDDDNYHNMENSQ